MITHNIAILDPIQVMIEGVRTPMNEIATVGVKDGTLILSVFEEEVRSLPQFLNTLNY